MSLSISSSELRILQREADQAARRLVRRLRLPSSDVADLRQDLLLDLISRLPAFDPERGSLGAFAGTVTTHRSVGIAHRIRRDRRLFGAVPVSIDDPERSALRHTIADDGSLSSLYGGWHDARTNVELARDVARAIEVLPSPLRDLCALLQSETPTGARRKSGLSHATFYRRLREIRLRLLVEGVQVPA